MDIDGVHAQTCFPSYARFAGTRFLFAKDKELALLCVQAYNDFMLDEWCAAAPDRYIPLVILPLWDTALAVAEVHRTAAKGAKTIAFPENTVPLDLPSIYTDHWDHVFAAVQEVGLPLSMHIGTSGKNPVPTPESPDPVIMSLMSCNSMSAAADWIFSPVFHKFPRLKVALSEGGIGWMPYLAEKMDYVWDRQRYWSGINQEARPSEIMRQHIYGCFIDDVTGIKNRYDIGIENIMWESDYPHADTHWPHSRKRAAEVLADVSDHEAHRIVELNARELFNFDG
jgi:predicted TIM-barrel fold metal-dependent hydrolase